jgi:hypothetical protein
MKLRDFRLGGLSLVGASLLLTSGIASATPITGMFGFDSPGVLAFSTGSGAFIDFCASVTGTTCNNNASGTGVFTVTGSGTNDFSVLSALTTGIIDDLSNEPGQTGYTYLPVGVPVSVDNVIALTANPAEATWDFQANLLPLATCPLGGLCLGPFQLNQNGSNVSVELNIYGIVCNGTCIPANESSLDIAITGNYTQTTAAAVAAGAETPTGVFSDNMSASVIVTPLAAVPEPATSAMVLAGVGLLLLARKQRGRRS